jgi:hypothetical protein
LKKVLLQRGSCIPSWMKFLARFYPFVFCYRCVERLEDQNEPVVITRLSVFKNWAIKRCAICGKKIDVPI